jgi:MoaA/NifB/PqqE/SkfB family radical SAM enzyme
MKSGVRESKPIFGIHSGWHLRCHQAAFALSAVRYLQKSKYPLFTIKGAISAYRIGRALKLHKLTQLNRGFFTTPILPHYPSRAFDHMVAGGGLNISEAGTPMKTQISMILLGITRKCSLRCLHCYEHFNLGTEDIVPLSRWKEVIREIQGVGAGVVVFSGGEPMQRYECLLELLESGNKDHSDFHLHTSGQGVTPERARELRQAGLTAAAVGLDDVDADRHDELRGFQGAHGQAVRALQDFHTAGIFTYTNMCLTKEIIKKGDLWAYLDLMKELKVGCIEMLEPRPCGGYSSGNNILLTADERKKATEFFIQGNTRRKYRHHPLIYYVAYTEAPEQMGCMMGGLSHMTIDTKGNVNPCVFLPVTFGNIMKEDFPSIYRRMREAIPRPIHRECPSISLAPRLEAKAQTHAGWPVPYDSIRDEWDAMMTTESPIVQDCTIG